MNMGDACVAVVSAAPRAEACDAVAAAVGAATSAESLDYLLEIIGELGALATRAGYPTLAGILDLAQREARLQRMAA
jgi:hypothetical protein